MIDTDPTIERFNALLNPEAEPISDPVEDRSESHDEPTSEARPRQSARELCTKYGIDPDEFYSANLTIDDGEEVSIGQWKDARRDLRQSEKSRAEITEESQRIHHAREAARQQTEQAGQRAQQAETILQSAINSFREDANKVDWQYLQDTDPAEYQAKRQEFAEREGQLHQASQAALQLKGQAERERQNHEQEKIAEHYRAEQKILFELIPEINPKKHGIEPLGRFISWAERKGFAPGYLNTISDARLVASLYKSMRYDELT